MKISPYKPPTKKRQTHGHKQQNPWTIASFYIAFLPLVGVLAIPPLLVGLAKNGKAPHKTHEKAALTLATFWAVIIAFSLTTPLPNLNKTPNKPSTQTDLPSQQNEKKEINNNPTKELAEESKTKRQTNALKNLTLILIPEQTEENIQTSVKTLSQIIKSPEEYNPPCLLLAGHIAWTLGQVKTSSKLLETGAFLAEIGWLRAASDCNLFVESHPKSHQEILEDFKNTLQPSEEILTVTQKKDTIADAISWDKRNPKDYPRDWPKSHKSKGTPLKTLKPQILWEKSDEDTRKTWEHRQNPSC
jgi:hypothetical protein